MAAIRSDTFGKTKEGNSVTAFTLSGEGGMAVTVLNYGATIQSVIVPDRRGTPLDVALGYDDLSSYEAGSCCYGATIGRFANRIGGGRFVLDGREYLLEKNSEENRNHIHGVFTKRIFEAFEKDGRLLLKYFSPDMEEGYPGNLELTVGFQITGDNALEIEYTAATDAPTVINLSNHCYFNLNGPDASTVLNHRVWLNSSHYTEYDEHFAQTGNIISVENTPLDFRKAHTIGERFADDYPPFRVCTGYDHNMVLDGEPGAYKPIGTAESDVTGIRLEAFTTEPAFQFYSGNFIHCDPVQRGKGGVRYPKNGGFCMEAQHYPDSVNHPHFPDCVLRPGEIYRQKTVYRFRTF
ncbi:MAG: galactose mutarotase [Lachnospiraceae bacterium]|nr:galactose mutarotase [Lachnospiraceae bacterium]